MQTEIHLAAAHHALGQTRLATETLMRAQDLALVKDQKHLAQIKAGLGAIYILNSPPIKDHSLHGQMSEHEDVAEATLKESIKLSRERKTGILRRWLGTISATFTAIEPDTTTR